MSLERMIDSFVEEPPFEADFPLGGQTTIPTAEELGLLCELGRATPMTLEGVASLCDHVATVRRAYVMVTFAVRMAVHAARTNSIGTLRLSLLALVLDQVVDYRDILRGLAVFEDCASRLGTTLGAAAQEGVAVAAEDRRRIIEEYLERPPEMRGLRVMRFEVSGAHETLQYRDLQR
jgi:predicted metalloprotease with PDZ domain